MSKGRKAYVVAYDERILGEDGKYYTKTFFDPKKFFEHEGSAMAFVLDINAETKDEPYYVKQIWIED